MNRCEKKLTANDLGLTGTHQAGVTIPKQPDFLAFFPELDSTVFNPSDDVEVKERKSGEAWTFKFIYYNGKRHGMNTRNEYRLTGMTKFLRSIGANVDDTLVFERGKEDDQIWVSLKRVGSPDADKEHESETITLSGRWKIIITR